MSCSISVSLKAALNVSIDRRIGLLKRCGLLVGSKVLGLVIFLMVNQIEPRVKGLSQGFNVGIRGTTSTALFAIGCREFGAEFFSHIR